MGIPFSGLEVERDRSRDPVERDVRPFVDLARGTLIGGLDEREDDLVGGHEDRPDVLHRRPLGRHGPRRSLEAGNHAPSDGLVDARPVALDEERLGRRWVGVVAVHRAGP